MPFAAVLRVEPAPEGVADALRAHGGLEASRDIDGVTATFLSAADAVACAIELARAGAERVGVDAGENDFDATLVATRLAEAAVAGQVLVSETVRLLAGQGSPAPMRAAGALRLRGVGQPVGMAEVLHGDVPAPAPPRDGLITVAIADDQALLRAGFRVIVEAEADMTVIGEAGDGQWPSTWSGACGPTSCSWTSACPSSTACAPPRRSWATRARDRGAHAHDVRPREYVYDALRLGASGFLLKDAPAARLLDAIRVAAAGDALLEPSITRRLIEQFARVAAPRRGDGPPEAVASLTPRELEVLRLLARGMSNAEIAAGSSSASRR